MAFSPLLAQLIEQFQVLPGVGQKTAQRFAFSLLEADPEKARRLAHSLEQAVSAIKHCRQCRTYSETELCGICQNGHRDATSICVVESPVEQMALEQSGIYDGFYFVLHGRLSPLDGIGPEEIGCELLAQRLQSPGLEEVILATNTTVEGEATSLFLQDLAKQYGKKVSRIAYGVPMGRELEYVDTQTLSHAFRSRLPLV